MDLNSELATLQAWEWEITALQRDSADFCWVFLSLNVPGWRVFHSYSLGWLLLGRAVNPFLYLCVPSLPLSLPWSRLQTARLPCLGVTTWKLTEFLHRLSCKCGEEQAWWNGCRITALEQCCSWRWLEACFLPPTRVNAGYPAGQIPCSSICPSITNL